MNLYPKIQLSQLRRIGWDLWDPIGIRSFGRDDWQTDAADEYDCYLLHVASMLQGGRSTEEAAAYLDWVSSEHMGLGAVTVEARKASADTIEAIVTI